MPVVVKEIAILQTGKYRYGWESVEDRQGALDVFRELDSGSGINGDEAEPYIQFKPADRKFPRDLLMNLKNIRIRHEGTKLSSFSDIEVTSDGAFRIHFGTREQEAPRDLGYRQIAKSVENEVELPSTLLVGDPTRGRWDLPQDMQEWLESLGPMAINLARINGAAPWFWETREYPFDVKTVEVISDHPHIDGVYHRFRLVVVFAEKETADAFAAKFTPKSAAEMTDDERSNVLVEFLTKSRWERDFDIRVLSYLLRHPEQFDSAHPSGAALKWREIAQRMREDRLRKMDAEIVDEVTAFYANPPEPTQEVFDILSGEQTKWSGDNKAAYELGTAINAELKRRADVINTQTPLETAQAEWYAQADRFIGFMTDHFPAVVSLTVAREAISPFRVPFNVIKMKNFSKFSMKYRSDLLGSDAK